MYEERDSVPALVTRPGGAESTRLYEREEALTALDIAVARAGRGEGRAIFFLGEAGQGKTSLLSVARARHGGSMALSAARGHAMESDLPFAFMEQALDFMSGATGAAGDGGARVPAEEDEDGQPVAGAGDVGRDALGRRTELFALARSRLRQMAQDRPVLVLLDDIHWADADSLRLLLYLVRRAAQLPVIFVGTLRPWPPEAQSEIDLLAADGLADVVRLRSLSEPASAALVEALTTAELEGEQVARAWRLTGGNPLLLVEAARVLRVHGRLPVGAHSEPTGAAATLLLSHVAGLPPDAVNVVQAAAVLGQSFSLGVLQDVSGLSPEAFAQAFDVAVLAGLLRSDGPGRGAFLHELLAASIYEDTPPARRRLLHLRAFEHWLGTNDEDSAVPHVVAGGLGDDPRAGPLLVRAGERALREGALETGLTHLRRAVDISGAAAPDEWLETLADALFLAGHFEQSLQTYRRALALTRTGDGALAAKEARALVYCGLFEESLAVFDQLVDAALAERDPFRLVPLLVERGHTVWETAGPIAARSSMDVPDDLPMPDALTEVLDSVRAAYDFHAGDLSGVPELQRQAAKARRLSQAGHAPDAGSSTNAFLQYVAVCAATERYEEAEIYVQAGLDQFGGAGALWLSIPLRMQRVGRLMVQGQLVAAMTEIDDVEEELDAGSLLLPYFLQVRARALSYLGDFEGSAEARRQSLELGGGQTWYVRIALDMAEGHAHLFAGDDDAAADVFARAEATANAHGLGNPCILMWPAGAIESALSAGRIEQAARVVDLLDAQTADFGLDWTKMLVLGGRAGLAAAAGDAASAERLYEAALSLPCTVPLDRVPIAVRYGRWLRQHHQAVRARPILAGALGTAEELGALPLAQWAATELAAAGGRRRRSGGESGGHDPSTANGGGGARVLTVQQARVAAFAVTGATTKEIAQSLHLSPRTVESHLGAVFVRLGVRSKSELRRRRAEFDALLEAT